MQQAPVSQQSQNFEQPGMNFQVKQQNQNPISDIFSALHSLRFSPQKPQGTNPLPTASCGYKQNYEQVPALPQNQPGSTFSTGSNNPQYSNQVPESAKPTFTFQFVPVSPQNKAAENQQVMQNTIPVQFLASGQSQTASQQGPSYYVQNQPTNNMASQQVPTVQSSQNNQNSFAQSQPIVFRINPQPTTGQSQSVYTLQPSQPSARSGNQQKATQSAQPNISSGNPMALLMSQLQSPSGNLDISSILPMLMNSKQEKSGGMKALLPLILNLLNDKGCGCPHCGCPYNNAEPTINGGYSNQMNYSKQNLPDAGKITEPTKNVVKIIEESSEVDITKAPKKYKTNVISDVSEEASDEDDEYEDYDD